VQEGQAERVRRGWDDFLTTPLAAVLERHRSASPEAAALALFHTVAASVPAYRDLLRELGVDPAAVRTPEDFRRLPLLTRDGYLRRFPLAARCRGGALEACDMIAVSSGSTGEPTFWPRSLTDELAVARRFEQVFLDAFAADRRRTLAVVCFPLGTWVGGMYTASCVRHLAAKGYPITVVSPGNNKEEILRVTTALAPAFEQVVLLGYPPFLKDVVDTGLSRGVDWAGFLAGGVPIPFRLVLAGEVFSEEWRALVGERIGCRSLATSFASLYGTADAGVLGNETPLSVCIRRFLAARPELARDLFGEARLPTLVQYDPLSRFFEVEDGTLLFTGDNGVPLIRYHIADTGGLFPFADLLARLASAGFDPLAELAREGVTAVRDLPFVYVFGRSHFTVSYFGANVFPENVAVGLEQPLVRGWVTGKFVLQTKEDADRDRFLSVVVELAHGAEASEERRAAVASSIATHVARLNSEFASYVPKERQVPVVELRPLGDPEHFPLGVKHRYTRK
jgi:phenylacetate-CoA ligase